MAIFSLIIINKAGGLIYNRAFQEEGGLNKLTTNDYLVLAGTFHGVHAITARLNPLRQRSRSSRSSFPPGTPSGRAGSMSSTTSPNATVIAAGGGAVVVHRAPSPGVDVSASSIYHGSGGSSTMVHHHVPSRPEPPSGLEVLETEDFRMQCFNTLTGTKFLLFTDTTQANVDMTIRKIYDLYCDYVMKNPFYQLEMPVRCEMFDRKLASYIREINSR